jgi:hypothetical protein
MRTLEVTTPEGRAWEVRVAWQPRWRALARRFGGWRRKSRAEREWREFGGGGIGGGRSRGRGGGGWDIVPDFDADFFAAVAVIIGLIVFGLLFWFVLLPVLLLFLDAVVVILLLLIAIPARILFRRPWTVEATSPNAEDPEMQDWFATDVVGWRRALETRDEIAQKLASGYPPPIAGTLATRET